MPPDIPPDDAGVVGGPASGGPVSGDPDARPLHVVAGGLAEPDWQLVARVLAGEGTAADRAALARWAAADPARRDELDALGRWWEASARLPTPSRLDAMWRNVSAHVAAGDVAEADVADGGIRGGSTVDGQAGDRVPERAPARVLHLVATGREHPGARPERRRAIAVAAAALLASVSGLAWWHLAPGLRSAGARADLLPPREFATRRGQQATVTLADGSRVTLGPESRIRVHPFAASRRVELTGEAVFTVRHDPARPFLVHAAHAVTEDLGTTFGVRAYPGDTLVRVVVAEGAVALRAAGAPAGTGARLDAGDVGHLDPAGRASLSPGDPAIEFAWTRGRVAFHSAPLGQVAADLGRRYDVLIRFARPADAQRRITVEMTAGPLSEVLDAVTVPLALEHHREGDTVLVSPATR